MAEDIRDVLEALHHLQDRLADLNGRLRRGPILLKTQENNIQKAAVKLDAAKAEYQELLADARQKEQEVNSRDQAIARRKAQLTEAKTNKEFQALQLQIEADLATRDVSEGEALDAIEKAEKYTANLPPIQEEIDKAKEIYEATKKKFFAEKPEIEAEIEEFTAKLKAEEAKLPKEFREVYNRLVNSNGGSEALAVVENTKYCGGCNLQVPINSLAQIIAKKPIVCSSCARLLYVPKDYVFDKG